MGRQAGQALRRGITCAWLLCALAGPVRALDISLETPGASEALRGQLAGASLSLSAVERGLDTPQEILAAARNDYQTLIGILYDNGYYSPVINIRLDGREAADIPALETPRAVRSLDVRVETGPVFRFGAAEIGPLANGTTLPETFRSGAIAPTGTLQAAAQAGIGRWRDLGHAKARVAEQSIIARHSDALLDARIRLDPGPELRFGTLVIRGNEAVRTGAIDRIAGFPKGGRFSPEDARTVARRLRRTGTFTSVSLREAEVPNPDGTLDFILTVDEAKPRRIEVGAEISSRRGLDLTFNWTHRNLFGGAERFQFESRLRNVGGDTEPDGQVSVRLDRPAFFGPDNDLFYFGNFERIRETHYEITALRGGIGWRRIYSPERFAELAVGVAHNRADDAFGTDRTFDMIQFPGRYQWDKRDDPVSATEGFFLGVDLVPYIGFNQSRSGIHALVDGRGYLSLGARTVLAGRFQLGSAVGSALSQTSPDLLFFSGGAGTVRGQPFESLGVPVGANTAGGRSFLGLSAEVRTRITDKITLVGFYDYGAVDDDSLITGAAASHSGAGLGVRYDVAGLGAIRFDLAQPVSGSTSDGLQFYFGIGQAF